MGVIPINESDIHGMVRDVLYRLLESTDEKSGVIMHGKSDAIEKIVDYISSWWKTKKNNPPDDIRDAYYEGNVIGEYYLYDGMVDPSITEEIGLAENLELEFNVMDLRVDMSQYGGLIQRSHRLTGGAALAGEQYMYYRPATAKFINSKIQLKIPAFNGNIEMDGVGPALYHELNHSMTNLRISQKGYRRKSMMDMNRQHSPDKHINMMKSLHPDAFESLRRSLMYGEEGSEKLRAVVYIVYGLWETTERNARAESLYGELRSMKSTRATFKQDFQKTEAFMNINQFNDLIHSGETIPDTSDIWTDVGKLVGGSDPASVKRRFLKRSRELNDVLYKKMMKVANQYFMDQESAGSR